MKHATNSVVAGSLSAALFVCALASGAAHAQPWFDGGWPSRAKLTVPHQQVASPLAGFTVYVDLFSLGEAYFTTAKADGSDLVVTAADGTTELASEVTGLDLAARRGSLWFSAPVLDSVADTTFFIYWGKPSATKSNQYAAWGPSYSGVFHLDDTASTSVASSTTTSDGGTVLQSVPGQVTQHVVGKLSWAARFAGAGHFDPGYRINIPYAPALDLANDAGTVTAWVMADPNSSAIGGCDAGTELSVVSKTGFVNSNAASGYELLLAGRKIRGCIGAVGSWDCVTGTTCMSVGEWHRLSMSWDATTVWLYVDGVLETTFTPRRFVMATGPYSLDFGHRPRGQLSSGSYWAGLIDEVQVARAVRTADWLATEYANQDKPYVFMRTGPHESVGGVISPVIRWVSAQPSVVKDTDAVTIDVWADSPGHTVTVNATALDTGAGSVSVADHGDGTYRVTYVVTAGNTRPDGVAQLPVRVQNSQGQVASSTQASVTLDNTSPIISSAFAAPVQVFNGTDVFVSVTTDSQGYAVSGDFSFLDTTFVPGSETVVDNHDGTYLIRWTVGTLNTQVPGVYPIRVSVSDGPNTVVSSAAHVQYGVGATPKILSVDAMPTTVRNGDVVTLTVIANGAGYTASAGFNNVDTSYVSGDELVTNNGDGSYVIRYTVGLANRRADGVYSVTVLVTDSLGTAGVNSDTMLTLANGATDAGASDGGSADGGSITDAGSTLVAFTTTPPTVSHCGLVWAYTPALAASANGTWSVSGPDAGLDPSTGALTWVPTRDDEGTQHFTLRAQTTEGLAEQSFDVVVACISVKHPLGCGCSMGDGVGSVVLAVLALALRRRRT